MWVFLRLNALVASSPTVIQINGKNYNAKFFCQYRHHPALVGFTVKLAQGSCTPDPSSTGGCLNVKTFYVHDHFG